MNSLGRAIGLLGPSLFLAGCFSTSGARADNTMETIHSIQWHFIPPDTVPRAFLDLRLYDFYPAGYLSAQTDRHPDGHPLKVGWHQVDDLGGLQELFNRASEGIRAKKYERDQVKGDRPGLTIRVETSLGDYVFREDVLNLTGARLPASHPHTFVAEGDSETWIVHKSKRVIDSRVERPPFSDRTILVITWNEDPKHGTRFATLYGCGLMVLGDSGGKKGWYRASDLKALQTLFDRAAEAVRGKPEGDGKTALSTEGGSPFRVTVTTESRQICFREDILKLNGGALPSHEAHTFQEGTGGSPYWIAVESDAVIDNRIQP